MARILIVDDDADFRRMLLQVLVRGGHEVREAPDGRIALKLDLETPFEMAIVDLFMPEKEGLETILELRGRRPGLVIIAISGGDPVGRGVNLAVAKTFGARCTMTKPFSPIQLLHEIDQLLRSPDATRGSMAEPRQESA